MKGQASRRGVGGGAGERGMGSGAEFRETEIGRIPVGWKVEELREIVNFKTGKLDSNFADENGKYPFFTCAPEPLKIKSFSFDCEAILLAGNNANGIFHTNYYKGKFDAYQRTYVVTPKNNFIYLKYLFYQLNLRLNYLKDVSQGTVTKFLTMKILNNLKISLPDLSEQRAIASILGSLDDKIELNRQMNATLEQIGQAIFKHWFADFEFPNEDGTPYRSSGGEMVDSGQGAVPEGWGVGSILEISELLSGGTPKTKIAEYWGGEIPWVSAKDVTNARGTFILDTEKTITRLGIEHSSTKLLPKNTTVVTARGTVGSYCILSREMTINQTNYGLKAKYEGEDFFVFFSISNLVNQMKIHSYGTVFDTITTKTFKDMKIPIPPELIIKSFDNKVSSIMNQISHNLYESHNLATIRDALLPKLMSGIIRV